MLSNLLLKEQENHTSLVISVNMVGLSAVAKLLVQSYFMTSKRISMES